MFAPFIQLRFTIDEDIAKIRLYNFDPLKPHFYIVKLGFTGVNIVFFSYFAEKKKTMDCGYS